MKRAIITALLIGTFAISSAGAADHIRVAAAASLRHIWPTLIEAFDPAAKVNVSFGSSGNLLRQIRQGAPFDLFLSANEAFAEGLVDDGFASSESTVYATGRLSVAIHPNRWKGAADPETVIPALGEQLESGDLNRLAIANPAHAPYGMAAREALESHGLWERWSASLSLGENAAQTLQFVLAGAADAALVPTPLARDPAVSDRLIIIDLPLSAHQPLHHRMVRLGDNVSDATDSLYEWLQSAEAQALFQQHGFSLPR